MAYSAKILLDSVSETGKRVTTFEITFPRCVLAEAETHRVFRGFDGNVDELVIHNLGINHDPNFSRNSASSRAIPINKMLDKVKNDPFIPEQWGKPAKGMGAKEYWALDSLEHNSLTNECINQLNETISYVEASMDIANKEDLNRYLEPWLFHTAIITATEFDNFFKLRTNEAADWKIKKIADMMYDLYHEAGETIEKSKNVKGLNTIHSPHHVQFLKQGEWHTPLVYVEDDDLIFKWAKYTQNFDEDFDQLLLETRKQISVARTARISYLTHDGKRDIEKDLELFERLRTSGHWSPFEHVLAPHFNPKHSYTLIDQDVCMWNKLDLPSGNFLGWKPYRKEFQDENCTHFRKGE